MARQPVAVVVQDDEPLAHVMAEVLKGEGYEVLHADDEGSAAEVCGSRTVDLIVVDLRGPSQGRDALEEALDASDELALLEVRDEPAVMLPFFGPWRIEGRRLTLRRPFRLTDFVDAVRESSVTRKSA